MKTDRTTQFNQSTLLPWVEIRVADHCRACYQAHSHDEFSFGLIEQGQADYRNLNQHHIIERGDLVTINPSDVHSCNPKAGTWSYTMLFVGTQQLGQIQQEVFASNQDYLAFEAAVEQQPELKQRFADLVHSLQQQDTLHAETAMYAFVEQAFASNSVAQAAKTPVAPEIRQVREQLLDQLDQEQQLEQLAEQAGLSRYQLLRHFKAQYGLPPHAFVIDERIKRAKTMLRAGTTIAEVALSLGFADQAHFQRQFKQKLAVTPKYYQSHFV